MPIFTKDQMERMQKHVPFVKRYKTEIAASVASVFTTGVAYPLDSIKTRMQTHKYGGVFDCVGQTYRVEGLGGFFRGVLAPMASVTLVRTVSFSIYHWSKHELSDWMETNFNVNPLRHVHTKGTYPNLWTMSCFAGAGALAGGAITVIACPFELTKLSAQVSVLLADHKNREQVSRKCYETGLSYQSKGTWATMRNIIRHRGYLGLYTGFKLHLYRDTLGSALYFMIYESGKHYVQTATEHSKSTSSIVMLAPGGLCGVMSWALFYPIDSAKSNYQKTALMYTRGEKVPPAPKIQWFNRGMYRGLGVSMVRSFIVNSLFFTTFELVKQNIRGLE